MSVVQIINKHIENMPLGEPFTTAELLKYGSRTNVDKILTRLVNAGKLTRVARGIFVKSKKSAHLNADSVLPGPGKIVSTIARGSGETIVPHGADAALQLQLSTQVPTKPVFLTSGSTRHIKVGNVEIVLKHASHRKIANAGTIVGLVISALWYFGKNRVNTQMIQQIQNKLTPEQFSLVQESSASMPSWMADVFYHYKQECIHAHIQ